MILTCPQCDTKYFVKDGAIPPGGRQVRCASCKHSWHQDPETGSDTETPVTGLSSPGAAGIGGPPVPDVAGTDQPPFGDQSAVDDDTLGFASGAVGEVADDTASSDPQFGENAAFDGNYGLTAPSAAAPLASQSAQGAPPAYDDDPPLSETLIDDDAVADDAGADDEDFSIRGFDEDEGTRSGRLFKAVLAVVVLVAIAVAAFWYFAPSDLQARLGLTRADSSPLKIMLDSRDRQPLQSGNELLAISGRVINPTDEEQPVPAIRAELRNRQSQKLIYSWTIRPQSRVLPPNGMTRFNSAEVDVPQGGDDISLSLGGE